MIWALGVPGVWFTGGFYGASGGGTVPKSSWLVLARRRGRR